MAKENKQLIKTWEYRYQDYLNSGLSINKWFTLNGVANSSIAFYDIVQGSFGQDACLQIYLYRLGYKYICNRR